MTDTGLTNRRAALRGIDQLDIDIVQRLRVNPTIANSDLARDFGVSNATIGARIARLKDLRMARVVGATPARAAGYEAIGWVGVWLRPQAVPRLKEVAMEVTGLPGMIAVASQLGDEHLGAMTIAESIYTLDQVASQLGEIEGVDAVRVTLMTNAVKERTDIGYRKEPPPTAQVRYEYLSKTLLSRRLSDLELRLLAEYQSDGRLSAREVARRLDISEPSARSKIRQLRENGLLVFVTESHPATFGLGRAANLRIDVEPKHAAAFMAALVERDEVSVASSLMGDEYAIGAVVHAAALDKFIHQWIYAQPGVRRVKVMDILRSYLHDTNWIQGWGPGAAGNIPDDIG